MRSSLLLLIVVAVFVASTSQHPTSPSLPATIPCGYVVTSNRIREGGRITEINGFPWTALLFYGDGDSAAPRCGGVLISQSLVVTAASCFIGDGKYKNLSFVRLGEYDMNMNPDCIHENGKEQCYETQVDIKPKNIIIPLEFQPNTANQHHDIALIELEQPVNYTHFIQPICLPDQSFEISAERNFTAAGWGITDHFREQGYPNIVSPIKLKHELQLFDRQACQDVYSSQITLGSDQFCFAVAGEPTKDTCSGFSGSPLMILMDTPERSFWMLVGLVSHELQKCDSEGKPGIYTNVKQHVDWIKENEEDLEISKTLAAQQMHSSTN